MEMKLPAVQAKLATTLWNTRRTTGLNDCQKEAVKLALSNRFVMIHGPPGKYRFPISYSVIAI